MKSDSRRWIGLWVLMGAFISPAYGETSDPALCQLQHLKVKARGVPPEFFAKTKHFEFLFITPNIVDGELSTAMGGFDIVDMKNKRRCHASNGTTDARLVFVNKNETEIFAASGDGVRSWPESFSTADCKPLIKPNPSDGEIPACWIPR